MAGYVYKGSPVVHTGIVKSGQTVKGGQFVTLTATDGTIAPTAKDAADTGVYLVVDVRREDNLPGDDATYYSLLPMVQMQSEKDCAEFIDSNRKRNLSILEKRGFVLEF